MARIVIDGFHVDATLGADEKKAAIGKLDVGTPRPVRPDAVTGEDGKIGNGLFRLGFRESLDRDAWICCEKAGLARASDARRSSLHRRWQRPEVQERFAGGPESGRVGGIGAISSFL